MAKTNVQHYEPRFNGVDAIAKAELDEAGGKPYSGDDFTDREQVAGATSDHDEVDLKMAGFEMRNFLDRLLTALPVDVTPLHLSPDEEPAQPWAWFRYNMLSSFIDCVERQLLTEFTSNGKTVRRGVLAKIDRERNRFLGLARSGRFGQNPGLAEHISGRVAQLQEQAAVLTAMRDEALAVYGEFAETADIQVPLDGSPAARKASWQQQLGQVRQMDGQAYEAAVRMFGKAEADKLLREVDPQAEAAAKRQEAKAAGDKAKLVQDAVASLLKAIQ